MEKNEKEELKNILEETARTCEFDLNGEIAELKSPEQKEAEREVQAWKTEVKNYSPMPEFVIPYNLIRVLLSTSQYNGLVLKGVGGIGKSVLTISTIKSLLPAEDWEYSNGYTTPLALYEFLYNHRNKKLIILDDVEGIFNNAISLSILKGALWDIDGKRITQYSSKSEKANMPSQFIMNAKIIILCNNIPKETDISTRALLTRTISYSIDFNFSEKIAICEHFVKADSSLLEAQKEKVIFLLKNNVNEATKDFNFRTLRKAIAFIIYDEHKAEELFKATTETDTDAEAYFKAIAVSSIVKHQYSIFFEMTGKGRSTFFNLKKKLKSPKVQSTKDMDFDKR